MEFPVFFIHSTIYTFSGNPGPALPALPFCGGKNHGNISSLDLSIELNRCGGGANLDAKCPASMEIVLEHFDHILRRVRRVFTGRKICQKKRRTQKKVGKKFHPRKMFKDLRVMTSVDENVWDQLRYMIYVPKFKKSQSIYHFNW